MSSDPAEWIPPLGEIGYTRETLIASLGSAGSLAAEEMDLVVTEWFAQVLQESPAGTDHMLSTRGRLALRTSRLPVRPRRGSESP